MKQVNNSSIREIQDPLISEKIELYIQQSENITIPAIIFEYIGKENSDFETNDLKNFYEQFGEIEDFVLNNKISVVLFKTFFSANTCRDFLENEKNFKNNLKKDFNVRWFNLENDSNLINEDSKIKFEEISSKNIINLKQNNLNNFNNNQNNNINIQNQNNNNNIIQNINGQIIPNNNNLNINNINIIQNQYIPQNMINMNNMNIPMNIINKSKNINMRNIYYNGMLNQNIINQNMYQNQNLNQNNKYYQNLQNQQNEEKSNIKYTCKYEILIQNDKDFQIARRLIGSKGCNMKNILEECKLIDKNNNSNINDIIKLRLRGKGSGYKEGPQNKESDDPLHLCISAKNKEIMNKACECVNELLSKIYDDYKKHCFKNGIQPLNKIAQKIDIGNNIVHNKGNFNMIH